MLRLSENRDHWAQKSSRQDGHHWKGVFKTAAAMRPHLCYLAMEPESKDGCDFKFERMKQSIQIPNFFLIINFWKSESWFLELQTVEYSCTVQAHPLYINRLFKELFWRPYFPKFSFTPANTSYTKVYGLIPCSLMENPLKGCPSRNTVPSPHLARLHWGPASPLFAPRVGLCAVWRR